MMGRIDSATKDSMINDLNSLTVDNTSSYDIPDDYRMEFVPGTYDLDAFMVLNSNINIPKETRSFCPLPKDIRDMHRRRKIYRHARTEF